MPQVAAIKHLSTSQLEAIELMLCGQTDTQIAKSIGVSRDTVCRWRNHNRHFKAALEYRQNQLWQSSAERLNRIAFRSLDLLETALAQGDVKTAFAILEILRLYEMKNGHAIEGGIENIG